MLTTNKKSSRGNVKNPRDDFFCLVGTIYPNIFRPIIEMISVTMKNRRQKEPGS